MTPSSVLVIKPSSLGDIVHTLPAVHFLKTTFRDADFYWIARSAKGRRILGLSDAREAAGYHYHERNPDAWIWKKPTHRSGPSNRRRGPLETITRASKPLSTRQVCTPTAVAMRSLLAIG
jgi:hypothetical protein